MRYYFICYCGCNQKSEPLEKDYVRLVGKKWSVEGHEEDNKILRKFKGGLIIKQEEF